MFFLEICAQYKKIRFHSKRICLVCAQYKKIGAIQKDLVADNEWSPYKSFFLVWAPLLSLLLTWRFWMQN
jgi:hypothetical protein